MSHSIYRKKWIVKQFENHANDFKFPKIGVLGLSYKENTHSIKNSPSVAFLENILRRGVQGSDIQVYDPVVKSLPDVLNVTFCHDAYQAAEKADMIFINTPWDEFRSLDLKKLVTTVRAEVIVDPFNLLRGQLFNGIKHVTLGTPS